jgi:hypothetical protein
MKVNKKQVNTWLKKWQTKLWLGEWDIQVTFEDIRHSKETEHYQSEGKAEVEQQYLSAHITFAEDVDITEDVVLHELLHILTSELSGFSLAQEGTDKKDTWTEYFDDRLITRLTRILLESKSGGITLAKKSKLPTQKEIAEHLTFRGRKLGL